MQTFKEQLKWVIIPSVEKMIKKEQDHLLFLQSQRPPNLDFEAKSKTFLAGLKLRLRQYKKYLMEIS